MNRSHVKDQGSGWYQPLNSDAGGNPAMSSKFGGKMGKKMSFDTQDSKTSLVHLPTQGRGLRKGVGAKQSTFSTSWK